MRERLGLFRAEIVGDRAATDDSVLRDEENVGEPWLALADRPSIHAVAEGARAAARRRDRPDRAFRILQDAREHLEAGATENLRHILHFDRVAQVRLVGAVFADRLGIRNERKFRRYRLAIGEFLEHPAQHRLDRGKDVVLRDKAHLHVELIELAGRAVGARILVAEAGRDLEIAVEARHHDELLELLRRLRQRVEFSRMQPRRHEIVARAFRRRRGQDRRLELKEALLFHPPPDRIDDLAALHDVVVQPLAAQVEELIFEPDLLRIFLLAEHRHGQFGSGPEHLDVVDVHLHRAGRQVRVHGAFRPVAHLAVDAYHPLRTQRLGQLEGRRIRVGHDLGKSVMVAQIDEQHAAMVADAVAPAGEPHRLPDIGLAELAAGVGAVAVHVRSLKGIAGRSRPSRRRAGKAHAGRALSRRANGRTAPSTRASAHACRLRC